jgi:hypothetical protein
LGAVLLPFARLDSGRHRYFRDAAKKAALFTVRFLDSERVSSYVAVQGKQRVGLRVLAAAVERIEDVSLIENGSCKVNAITSVERDALFPVGRFATPIRYSRLPRWVAGFLDIYTLSVVANPAPPAVSATRSVPSVLPP